VLKRLLHPALLALILFCGCGSDPAPDTTPASVLLVTLDTQRRDHIGAYGDGRGLTPHLDALAAEGLVHEAAFTTMPTTAPAHVSMFTGKLASEHGVLRNGDRLDPELAAEGVPAQLTQAGYATAAFVTSWVLAPTSTGLVGFESYDTPKRYVRNGAEAAEAALQWLEAESRRPVFLWVHLFDPHAPYGNAREKQESIPLPRGHYGWVDREHYATAAARQRMGLRYARGVAASDAALGQLVAGFRARVTGPSYVLVTSDHGESLDEHFETRGYAFDHGEFLDSESVEIPLVVAGPGIAPGRSRGAVSIRDVAGTLRRITGLAPDARGPGRDLRVSDDARRIVTIQRRQFATPTEPIVASHAFAASDGEHFVIVSEDGSATLAPGTASPDLLSAARAGITAEESRPLPVDPETRKALEALGYAE
jgi:arylsulfatase A-like enzyme